MLALGAIHIAFTRIWSIRRAPARAWRTRMLAALHALGIVVIGFIWHHAGGLQNPAFLMVFALPVVGAIFLSRWQPYLMALLGHRGRGVGRAGAGARAALVCERA